MEKAQANLLILEEEKRIDEINLSALGSIEKIILLKCKAKTKILLIININKWCQEEVIKCVVRQNDYFLKSLD